MGGGTKVEYKAPKIEKDDFFEKYLQDKLDREERAEERAEQARLDEEERTRIRNEAGKAGFKNYADSIQRQLNAGLITFNDATTSLDNYRSKYEMVPGGKRAAKITDTYLTEILPGRRDLGITAAYDEVLGREATKKERKIAQERFSTGLYSSIEDLRSSLSKSSEYRDKFNTSYLDNYYDTMFGKQEVDSEGKRTGVRTFKFGKNLLPSYSGDLDERTGLTIPEFKGKFQGTAGEIQEQLQNVRDTRQYLYSAGLTNLQGEINKETTKLRNEGAKELQKIKGQGDLYKSLVGTFSF
tara:strand:- start:504 stop:1394 length:891 start_codon:yes stop_codon:yes gene_type:complete